MLSYSYLLRDSEEHITHLIEAPTRSHHHSYRCHIPGCHCASPKVAARSSNWSVNIICDLSDGYSFRCSYYGGICGRSSACFSDPFRTPMTAFRITALCTTEVLPQHLGLSFSLLPSPPLSSSLLSTTTRRRKTVFRQLGKRQRPDQYRGFC